MFTSPFVRRAVDVVEGRQQFSDPIIRNPVIEGLARSSGGYQAVGSEFRKVLRKGGLAETDLGTERRYRHLACLGQPAEHHQTLLISQKSQRFADDLSLLLKIPYRLDVLHIGFNFSYC
jgi:hypothetical protein